MSTEAVTNKPDPSVGADRTEYLRAYYQDNKERILANRREQRKKNGPSYERKRDAERSAAKLALDAAMGKDQTGAKQKSCATAGVRASIYQKVAPVFDQLPDSFAPSEVGRLAGVNYRNPMLKVVLGQTFKCWQTASGMWRKR